MTRAERLRELAVWYREFAEKTGNPQIWAARLKHAEGLEAEAELATVLEEIKPGQIGQ
jgi:hypothetical protein